jgi:hypothetical protein
MGESVLLVILGGHSIAKANSIKEILRAAEQYDQLLSEIFENPPLR